MFKLGFIVATYPEANTVDVMLIDDGLRLTQVQVTSLSASSNTGLVDLPDISVTNGADPWNITSPLNRYLRGIIAFIDRIPICIGFLFPPVGQMSFDRKNFKVKRHASDVYSTINNEGDAEFYHPSGTYFRIGESPVHEDLTAQDFDKQWDIKNNTGKAVHAHLVVANAGAIVATFDIDPSGNVSLTHNGNLTVQTSGNLQATIGGTAAITSTGDTTVTAPNINLKGNTSITGTLDVSGATNIDNTLTTSGLATLAGLNVT